MYVAKCLSSSWAGIQSAKLLKSRVNEALRRIFTDLVYVEKYISFNFEAFAERETKEHVSSFCINNNNVALH